MAVHALNPKAEPAYGPVERQRKRHTLRFVGERLDGPVLDIGPANDFGRDLAAHYRVELANTEGDLDFDEWRPDREAPAGAFAAVFAFEVIEHLMNPLFFLVRLRRFCRPGARVFITYPVRPRFLWSDIHWHEIDRRRFLFLVDQAGYEVVRYQERLLWREWSFYLTGLRPFLRLTLGRTRSQMYELRPRSGADQG